MRYLCSFFEKLSVQKFVTEVLSQTADVLGRSFRCH